jgi:TonB-dependent receptor
MTKSNYKKTYSKSMLALAVASVFSSNYSTAQDATSTQEDNDTEVIQVLGIRGSLAKSMDIKRESIGVADAITAEDIGKFPDSNLAESLQRITGVSIDRQNGEGFQVTVRGFGPTYNQITLNGRSMPAAQLSPTGSGLITSRAFDMSAIAAEGVSGVTVYKTSQANTTSGGVGSTIDLQTRKPMDSGEEFTAIVGGKLLHDTTNRIGDDVTPELSGLVSWTNDIWGVSLVASHQERSSGSTGAFSNGWDFVSNPYGGDDDTNIYSNGQTDDIIITNAPPIGTQTNINPAIRYNRTDIERERDNAQLTIQFKPTDNIEATLDYTLASQETDTKRNEFSLWFGSNTFPVSAVQWDVDNGVATPLYFLTENEPNGFAPRDINFGAQGGSVESKLQSLGFNIDWNISDDFKATLDIHDTSNESLPGGSGPGNWWNVGIGSQGVGVQGIDFSGKLPILVGALAENSNGPGNVAGQIDAGDLSSTVRQIRNARTTNDITQIRLDLEYHLTDDLGVDFGIESREMEYSNKLSTDQTVLIGNWGAANPGDIPADMVDELNFHELFEGYPSTASQGAMDFFNSSYDGELGPLQTFGGTTYFVEDSNSLGELLSNNAGLDWIANPVDSTDRLIEEDITAAYIQFEYAGELGDVSYDIIAGVRYEETDVTSSAQVAPTVVTWQGDNDFSAQAGAAEDAELVVKGADYSHTLPSISASFQLTDDIVARAAWSKTIARANYAVLQHGISGIGGPAGGPTLLAGSRNGAATNGNVALEPIESTNFDVSFEWYYAESSYVSIGYFNKDVEDFIGTQTVETIADTTRDSSSGPRAQAALAELENRGLAVNPENLFRMIASMDDGQGGCVQNVNVSFNLCGQDYDAAEYLGLDGWENAVDLIALPEDPLAKLDASTPVNAKSASIDGWELAIQHFFGESGFGMQANATIVDGDVAFDVSDNTGNPQFALTGLSDSANLVLIYEKDKFNARITYNWRDEFLDNANVGFNEPQHTESYEQVDLSVGYNVTDSWSVSFEGINVLEADTRQFGRTQRQLRNLQIQGSRYSLSTRYVF